MKKTKCITLDADLDLYYRTNHPNINISGIINNLLRMHSRMDDENFGEEKELKEKLSELNKKIHNIEEERAKISMKIAMIQEKKEQQEKQDKALLNEEINQIVQIDNTLSNSSILRNI
jgi:CII-binding regulator of phage lambda lysogenization HflD